MADVFVSYARNDAPLAKRVAESLKAAGYDVWWDSELLPHHAFAQSIEKEVRAAKAVVVVWSEHAVASQWVRAEADLARSLDKLVQVSVDHCLPPLPFNQYQTADLRTWKGAASDPRWVKVLASVGLLTAGGAEVSAASVKSSRPFIGPGGWGRRRAIWVIGAAGMAVLAIGVLWLAWNAFQPPARGARIAVRPYQAIGETPSLRDFAMGLSESLRDTLNQDRLQTVSASDAATLQEPDLPAKLHALDVGLILSGTVQADGDTLTVRTRLEDPLHHATLWSADVSGPSRQPAPLQARVGARTIAVLGCSAKALKQKSGIADPDVLALFLQACDLVQTSYFGGGDDKVADTMFDTMREVARRAPNFAFAHSLLAINEASLIHQFPRQATTLRQEARREAQIAQTLDPKDPDSYLTQGMLRSELDFGGRERLFREAIAANPSWPNANGLLGGLMSDLGRLAEASDLYELAASVNPQSPDWNDAAVGGLVYLGQFSRADEELAHLRQLWPSAAIFWRTQTASLIYQHRWADALKSLDVASADPALAAPSYVARRRAEIDALSAHNPAALARLRGENLRLGPAEGAAAITGLAFLGFVDDAFGVAQRYQPVRPDGTDEPEFLFDPRTAALRQDPRFMALANKFGLPQYWRATGKWPDFCAVPGLPYNCQQEAAKLKPVSGLFPTGG